MKNEEKVPVEPKRIEQKKDEKVLSEHDKMMKQKYADMAMTLMCFNDGEDF